MPLPIVTDPGTSHCGACQVRTVGMCRHLLDGASGAPPRLKPDHRVSGPQQILYRADQQLDHLHIIREGWALRYVSLSAGRRMVMAILLPGDMISTLPLFSDRFGASVQMITAGRYCLYSREEVRQHLFGSDSGLSFWGRINREELESCARKMADIGRRPAAERIARLILDITGRLHQRGLPAQHEIPFPLTQQHIADATGLTPIHVSRTLNVFRQKEIMRLSRGVLVIHDPAQLHHVADMEPAP